MAGRIRKEAAGLLLWTAAATAALLAGTAAQAQDTSTRLPSSTHGHVTETGEIHSAAVLRRNGSPKYLGLIYNRATSACKHYDVKLAQSVPDYVLIGLYGNDGSRKGSLGRSFANVNMNGFANGEHIRLYFDANPDVPLNKSAQHFIVEATPNALGCPSSPGDEVRSSFAVYYDSWTVGQYESMQQTQWLTRNHTTQRHNGLRIARSHPACSEIRYDLAKVTHRGTVVFDLNTSNRYWYNTLVRLRVGSTSNKGASWSGVGNGELALGLGQASNGNQERVVMVVKDNQIYNQNTNVQGDHEFGVWVSCQSNPAISKAYVEGTLVIREWRGSFTNGPGHQDNASRTFLWSEVEGPYAQEGGVDTGIRWNRIHDGGCSVRAYLTHRFGALRSKGDAIYFSLRPIVYNRINGIVNQPVLVGEAANAHRQIDINPGDMALGLFINTEVNGSSLRQRFANTDRLTLSIGFEGYLKNPETGKIGDSGLHRSCSGVHRKTGGSAWKVTISRFRVHPHPVTASGIPGVRHNSEPAGPFLNAGTPPSGIAVGLHSWASGRVHNNMTITDPYDSNAQACKSYDYRTLTGGNWTYWREYYYHNNVSGDSGDSGRIVANSPTDHQFIRLHFHHMPGAGVHHVTVEFNETSGQPNCDQNHKVTLGYTITVVNRYAWRAGPEDATRGDFFPNSLTAALANGPADTGVRIDRSSKACREGDVELLGTGSNLFELQKYYRSFNGPDGRDQVASEGSAGSAVTDVKMGSEDTTELERDYHVRLFFKQDAAVAAGGEYTVEVEVEPSSSCSGNAGLPNAMTLTYAFTVNDDALAAWETGALDRTAPLPAASNYFIPAYLSSISRPTPTGINIHRITSECTFVNLDIDADNAEHFELYMMNKGQVLYNAGGGSSRTGAVMSKEYGRYAGLFFKKNAPIQAGAHTISITLSQDRTVCLPPAHLAPTTVLVYTLTLRDAQWQVGRADNAQARVAAKAGLDGLTQHADTGVRIQRSSPLCSDTVVSLSGPNAANFQLYGQTYAGIDGTPANSTIPVLSDVSGATITLNMREGGDKSYARLQFKPNLTWDEQVMRVSVEVSSASYCGHANAVPDPQTLGYALTITNAAWANQGEHVDYQPRALFAGDFAATSVPFYSGIAFHRSPSDCRRIDVRLDSAPSYLFLARYQGSRPASTAALSNITMDSGAGINNHNVRLFFSEQSTVPTGLLTVNLIATTNSGCATGGGVSFTTAWVLTIVSGSGVAWEARAQHSDSAAREFDASDLEASNVPTFTGLSFNRSPSRCPHVDFTLVSPPAYLEASLHRENGSAVTSGNPEDRFTSIPMDDDSDFVFNDHVRLYFKANAAVPAGTVAVTIEASESTTLCSNEANPFTVAWAMTITSATGTTTTTTGPVTPTMTVTASKWTRLSNRDVPVQTQFYAPAELAASNSPTDTGLSFHRSANTCRFVDVAMSGSSAVELVRYDANGQPASSTALRNIRMENRHADDNHLKLFYKANAAVTANSTLDVTLIATPNATSCSGVDLDPLTVSWSLLIDGSPPPPTARLVRARSTYYVSDQATGNVGITIEISGSRPMEGQILTTPSGKFGLVTIGAQNGNRLVVALEVASNARLTLGNTIAVRVEGVDRLDRSLSSNIVAFNIVIGDPGSAANLPTLNIDVGSRGIRSAGAHAIESVLDRPLPSGFSGFLEMLQNKEQELESGDIDLREFLAGQSFAMPLRNANGDASAFGFWMQAELASIEDDKTSADDSLTYEGDIFNAAFGLDYRFSAFAAGVGYGIHNLETDYREGASEGTYKMDLGVILPYISFDTVGGRLALAGGVGSGEVKTSAGDEKEETRDAEYTSYAFGYRHTLGEAADKFRIKGLLSNSSLDVDELDVDSEPLDSDGGSLRLALAYVREIEFDATGGVVSPGIEFAYSTNWGDGNTGATYGVAGNVGVKVDRLDIDGSYRYARGEESTVSGIVVGFRLSQGFGNLGLGLEARPSYGLDSTDALLSDDFELNAGALPKAELGLRTLVRMSYGLPVRGGVLTPYGGYEIRGGDDVATELGLRLGTGGERRWALGWRQDAAGDDEVKIEYWLQ
ncbi:MAG: hypothetical protein ISN26_00380 [Betaproteobacteria bacterium AqS2]|uniref:Autotransporter domain-containing protein n=1 Tax=Candidatus Amphirhobacter heronislandensis TaxID=1732024 RepID=A0A930UBI8_9GAMM|nr:hypothetical protein [Betaproteobacteria bacterium AqS2]